MKSFGSRKSYPENIDDTVYNTFEKFSERQIMARKLTKTQEKAIEKYYDTTHNIIIDADTADRIAEINDYETVYQDMDRYIWDYQSRLRNK